MLIILAIASYFNVFLLVLNSQFARDKKYLFAYCNSWLISVAAFAYTRIVAGTDDVTLAFFFSGFGASAGVFSAMHFYTWLTNKLNKGK